MSTPMTQLTFALQSFEDPLSAAMGHTMEYEQLTLQASAMHEITLQCVLPDDAHENDIISLSATYPSARDAQYFTEKVLTNADLERGYVYLTLSKITQSHCLVMQLMLHGLNATLKNSLQFDMQVNAFEAGYKNQQALKSQTKPHGVKKYFRNMSSSLFSFF
ncbi:MULTISPECIES: hypothetical protein [Pseudoalteromonas]|jgi:hypothetical protein|uniref:Uncharacterized protein n=3 Tax=Pseudoalteromonas agarivorans TaxID=176102 RepID=A0ABR5VW84_9GAMM|nr:MULTISPECIES: hypothetical protein [Pseudoalteromonas]MDC9520260.1 hypothetical protein [Pseudoalteromonas sp. Angola-31]MDY6889470.1 hypothetical protein [Pseudomonadota bacterium]ETJ48071.1 hypothetical protein X564_11415 [Pseudoalteromonas agarivorans]KYL33806.1 hypothetical protein A2I98_12445 [Pseudoalteromonas telluritireducens]MCK8095914.1 hypothetical protein [Pseudoalteromonas sp. 1CM17D]|tara:strand:- start:1047 stop:1532 length:486 start_codon:yes stop_codon:yes gene_type:complete